jgi:hypothetical protein
MNYKIDLLHGLKANRSLFLAIKLGGITLLKARFSLAVLLGRAIGHLPNTPTLQATPTQSTPLIQTQALHQLLLKMPQAFCQVSSTAFLMVLILSA